MNFDELVKQKRQHKRELFWGAGHTPGSKADPKIKVQELTTRLKEAFNRQSGLQQPAHSESEEQAEEERNARREHDAECVALVKDIGAALLGHDVWIAYTDIL